MTRRTNARIAGIAFLAYIAAGIASTVLSGRATRGEGVAAQLAAIAQHATDMHLTLVLGLVQCFAALVLAVTLYAITREQDPDLAMLALVCRVAEGVIPAVGMRKTLDLLWLASATGADAPGPEATHALGAFLLRGGGLPIDASFFAVGSTLFSWLLLRGRMIPVALAWLGVVASILLVVGLPLQLAGVLRGPVSQLMWIPMAAFEIPLALWFIFKGVGAPVRSQPA